MLTEIADEIRKAAVLNAVRHEGKANPQAVLGAILGEHQELRSQVKELMINIQAIVQEVNSTPLKKLLELANESSDKASKSRLEQPRKLPALPNADKYATIITRVAPNPDFVLHLGNARATILSHDYARMYNGKFILRFEDTDPRLKKAQLGYYEKIRQDLTWLDCRWDEEYIQSDRLPTYYEVGTTLIQKGAAYVCECAPEQFRERVNSSHACPDRELGADKQTDRWTKMLEGGYDEGKAVVRVKTDLADPNPAVRDWPAFRIIDTLKHPHPRVGSKFRVWPLYNLASGVDDHLLGITHVIRGKEHLTNMARQLFMYNHLSWSYPDAVHYGRLKIEGLTLSKSRMMRAVEENEITGVDDPRLGTLAALRRRGYSPRTLRELIWDIGPKPVDVTISWDNLNAMNRKIVDPIAHRYFFVPNPIQIRIRGVTETREVRPPLHPEHPEFGNRTLRIQATNHETTLLLAGSDLPLLKSKAEVRLMNLFNFQPFVTQTDEFDGQLVEEPTEQKVPIIQWVPYENRISVTVVMPDATRVEGFAEADLRAEPINSIVQFVRFGFGRIDSSSMDRMTIFFAHS